MVRLTVTGGGFPIPMLESAAKIGTMRVDWREPARQR
jgi:hypothetical protein